MKNGLNQNNFMGDRLVKRSFTQDNTTPEAVPGTVIPQTVASQAVASRAVVPESVKLEPAKPEPLRLLVGLGNPGPRYQNTRHNLGFMVLDEIARRQQLAWRKEKNAHSSQWGKTLIIKPQTFMNLSGKAVQAHVSKRGIRLEHILLIHDDLDLPLGRLRFRTGGSAGGQRGVQDTINRLGKNFHRLKLGISRPPEGWKVENWVLSRFRAEEKDLLAEVVATAADGLECVLEQGMTVAMNRYNGLDLR